MCVFCVFSELLPNGCKDGDVRLVARDSLASGQVQVCNESTWSRLCSQGWGRNETRVVCRQLEFSIAGKSTINIEHQVSTIISS